MKDVINLLIVVVLLGLYSLGFQKLIGASKTIKIHIDSSFCEQGKVKND